MSLTMPVVWSPETRLHDPDGGVWVGVRVADQENADRVDAILDALTSAGARLVDADPVGLDRLTSVHTPELVDFFRTAWALWEQSGYLEDPGQNRVVAYIHPHPDARPAPRVPVSPSARAGLFAMDTMTLLGPGSWRGIVAAASTAIRAADLVSSGAAGAAYALARPPGHHAGASFYGGSCYLNNAGLAADRLASLGTVTVVDIDAHHGNGTQQIFWDRADVVYGSVHVDPAYGWFPHYVGWADEVGGVAGSNVNIPLAPGTEDGPWLEAVDRLADRAAEGSALVVSLGVDAEVDDPESPLRVTIDGYAEAGRILGRLGLPTVIVQEGGYVLETLGHLVVAFLTGFEEATR